MADHQIADDRVHLTFCDGDGGFYQLSGATPPARMDRRARALARAMLDLAQRHVEQLDAEPELIRFGETGPEPVRAEALADMTYLGVHSVDEPLDPQHAFEVVTGWDGGGITLVCAACGPDSLLSAEAATLADLNTAAARHATEHHQES